MLGGGGSIVTVPALVYLLGQDVSTAAATSLLVVGANASLGGFGHQRAGRVRWRTALVFGAAGLAGALPGARLNRLLPAALVLVLFALVMLAAAVMMLRRKPVTAARGAADCRTWGEFLRAASAGVGVGLLTGFFGVGGGFLIVPALVGGLGFAMPEAVGTSLVIIALNSASGLLGYLLFGRVELGLALPLILGGAVGVLVGARFAGRLPEQALRRLFAGLLIALALFLVAQNAQALWR